ncbi:MAG: ribosome-binding factor A [Cellvibrionaceae bacterium]
MPKSFSRTNRVADAIKRLLSTLIQQEVADPNVGMVNINDVTVTRDLAYAKVYVTFIGQENDDECQRATEHLNKASGYLRSLLAKETSLRTTPKLQFYYDSTPKHGQKLSSLIDHAVTEDKSRNDPSREL